MRAFCENFIFRAKVGSLMRKLCFLFEKHDSYSKIRFSCENCFLLLPPQVASWEIPGWIESNRRQSFQSVRYWWVCSFSAVLPYPPNVACFFGGYGFFGVFRTHQCLPDQSSFWWVRFCRGFSYPPKVFTGEGWLEGPTDDFVCSSALRPRGASVMTFQ